MSSKLVLRLVGGGTAGAAAYVVYDYQTCQPMRKMQGYDVSGAFIRFHNTMRPTSSFPQMTIAELSQYNGDEGKPTYFASDGYVWDVSTSVNFKETYGLWKGKDASMALALMSMNPKDVNRTDWENLSEKDLESLHSWTKYFQEKYIIKATLKEFSDLKASR